MPPAAPPLLPLSALNHRLYCERRAYLIHAEGVFIDNEHTALGQLAHAAVDTPGYEHRAGWELLRALPLFSDTLGLSGKADLVEVRRADSAPAQISDSESGIHDRPAIVAARPVEYKKGPARRWANDHVQLCAQALCLEEMFGLRIESGLIFHAASARRDTVVFDAPLRALTLATLDALRTELARPSAPPAVLKPQCDGCSLRPVCLPEAATLRPADLFTPRDYP
jgi:CRISPR-associated exonuclease Cas4